MEGPSGIKFQGKRICLWGYGAEGKSTERFLKTHCNPLEVSIYEGKQPGLDEERFDYIIKSPGIKEEWYNDKYSSATDIFLSEFHDRTIGITGTKGKSTTTGLLYHVLSRNTEKKVLMVGNIGIPCLDLYDEIDQDTVIVFEMSCHQLAHLRVSPHVAVFLNLYEEHLDHYDTFDRYFQAKSNITLHQTKDDHLYIGDNVPDIDTAAAIRRISRDNGLKFETGLKGKHNQYNMAFVYSICRELFDIPDEKIRSSIKTFEGLKHRLEYIGETDGVDYYDDSISTIPEAAIAAAESVSNAATLLIGGFDRNINYSSLVQFIFDNPQLQFVFMYESGNRIYEQVKGREKCFLCADLKEAVELAKRITPEHKACILSPAAASYGHFTNFEERGDCFRKLVKGEAEV